jgi:hypothetical protein
MYIRFGQPFDIWQWHVMEDGYQFGPGAFADPDLDTKYAIFVVSEPVPPTVTDTQVVEFVEFQLISGVWTPIYNIRDKTPAELAADAAALAAAKVTKDQQINHWRELANLSSFPYAGKQIASDSLSYRDIMSIATYVLMFGEFEPGFPGAWKATDNTYVTITTVDDFKAMYAAMVAQGTANFNHAQALKGQLAAATRMPEVDAIVW